MSRLPLVLLALLLTACSPAGCVASRVADQAAKTAPATPADPAKPAKPAAPATGNSVADGVSNAAPADVVSWLLPWLAGILTVAIVVTVAVAAWMRSRSLALAAVGLVAGLGAVLILKLVLWTLAVLAGIAVVLLVGYLVREVWRHRAALAALDPLHHLLIRKT